MESIFNKIGYALSVQPGDAGDAVLDVLFINNTDGSLRWAWNAKNTQPIFLKFYNKNTRTNKLYALIVEIVFILRLQKMFFSKKRFYYKKSNMALFDCSKSWALYAGAKNKVVFYTNNNFFKVATTPQAQELIAKEDTALTDKDFRTFSVPLSRQISESIIQLSDITRGGVRAPQMGEGHLRALTEMYLTDDSVETISSWKLFNDLKKDFRQISDSRIPRNMIRKINVLITGIDINDTLNTSFSHGDFISGNIYERRRRISLYNWGMASNDRPKGFDYFHFHIQKGVAESKAWNEIYADIVNYCTGNFYEIVFESSEEILHQYLKYYLIVYCMSELKVFADQPLWNDEVYIQLKTLNDALNMFLADEKKPRQLVIMDLFDHIQNDNYATVKFFNGFPEGLSVNSSIDLFSNEPVGCKLACFLGKHSLVSKAVCVPRSFMNTIQIVLVDGSFLCVNIMWEAKNRSLVFMDVKTAIANAFMNGFGVKTVSVCDTMQYLYGLYTLNNAEIPEKYKVYEEASVEMNKVSDNNVKEYFKDFNTDRKTLLRNLKKMKQNMKLNRFKNVMYYIYDAITLLVRNTYLKFFSKMRTVQKSTLIKGVMQGVEKQLRRPEMVLHHKSSLQH